MRWPETLIRNWADRFAQKRASASHQAPTFRPRAGCSKHRQSGFVHLSMLLARWGKRPLSVQQLFASNASAPGLHFETYDPNTILARRNLITYSEQVDNAAWTAGAGIASITANATTAPDGTVTADLLTEDTATTNLRRRFMPAVTFAAGQTYVESIYAKPNGRNLSLAFPSGNFGAGGVTFNLATGAVGIVVSGTLAYGIEPAANGFYRCWIAQVCTTGGTSTCSVYLNSNAAQGPAGNNYTGDGVSGIYVWGGQVEVGSAPSAYQKITDWNSEFMAAGGERVTMFQDSTCITAVTKPEESIGGFISSERGTARGPNVLANPTFDANLNGWTISGNSGGNWTWVAGRAFLNGDSTPQSLQQLTVTEDGAWYELTFDYEITSGQLGVFTNGGGTVANLYSAGSGTASRLVFKAVGTGFEFKRANGTTCVAYVDNVSLRKLPGKVATQSTSGFKPKLDARVNLLTKTEQIDDPAWNKTDTTITPNATEAPDGKITADLLTEGTAATAITLQSFTVQAGVRYKAIARLKRSAVVTWVRFFVFDPANTGNQARVWFDLVNGAKGVAAATGTGFTLHASSIAADSAGFYLLAFEFTSATATALQVAVKSASGDGVTAPLNNSAYYLWGTDVRTASDAALDIPAYQRVNTSTDYDWTGFPMRVRGDQSDDFLTVPLNMTGTNKVTAWMSGDLKKGDASTQVLFELSASSTTTAGTFGMIAPVAGSADVQFRSGGSIPGAIKNAVPGTYPAPLNAVVCGEADIASDNVSLQINGVDVNPPQSADQGTGNYISDTLYIQARVGTTFRSGAGWTGLTIFGGTCTAGQRAAITRRHSRLAKVKL